MLPSGEQIAIAHGDQRAVVTEVGATLRTYVKGGVSVVEGFAGEEEGAQRGRVPITRTCPLCWASSRE